jgi:hypothetical protein
VGHTRRSTFPPKGSTIRTKTGERGRLRAGFNDQHIGREFREKVGPLEPSLMLALTTQHRMVNPELGVLPFMTINHATNDLPMFVTIR